MSYEAASYYGASSIYLLLAALSILSYGDSPGSDVKHIPQEYVMKPGIFSIQSDFHKWQFPWGGMGMGICQDS